MSHQAEFALPKVIDCLAFAQAGCTAAGAIEITSLPRLLEELAEQQGHLNCRVSGSQEEGKNWLTLELSGSLALECQRCLRKVAFPVEMRRRLLLVPAEQAWPEEELSDDSYDAVAAEREMALSSLIEDELLLALPISPMHDICEMPAPPIGNMEPSPFAALAKLKKGV